MPGFPDRELSSAGEGIELVGFESERNERPRRKVSISWGSGNKLRLSCFEQQQQQRNVPSLSSICKVVEVSVGSSSSHSFNNSAIRRLVYDTLPASALLQNRKQQALLHPPHSLPYEWWESVLEYSRSVSAVLGANRNSSGSATKLSSKYARVSELPSILQAIWDLLEIVYVDKDAFSWLSEKLINWLERYDKVLTVLEPTIHSKIAALQPRLVNTRFPEDDEDYWCCLTSALAAGWLDVVVKCLRMHGSYQHDQIDMRQTENGLVEAVVVLISKMPRMRANLRPDTLGVTYTFKPEFSKAWERWRNQIAKLNTSSFWLECSHEGTVNGLKRLLSVLLGDADAIAAATTHWMELLVSQFLFIRPFLMGSEGLLGLARKCVHLKPPSDHDQMLELLLGILGENTEVVLVECSKLFDPWMVTHMVELLLAKNGQAQAFLTEEREVLDGTSLEEFHRLVYAQLLSSHPCTWQLAPFYLASCPRQGRGLLEAVLLMQPVSSSKTSMKVLDICRMYDLRTAGEKYMRMIGVHYWKHGRKGLGISWLQQGRDYGRLSLAANELLTSVSQTSVGDSNRLQELEGLIDLLGPQFEGFGGLAFLSRFRDFKISFHNFQEAQTNAANFDKQVGVGKLATKHLMQLMKDGVTPQQFLLPLFLDSVELLQYSGEVLVTAAETSVLLRRLQNFFLTSRHDDTNSTDLSSQSITKIRLALAHNLGRAILKE